MAEVYRARGAKGSLNSSKKQMPTWIKVVIGISIGLFVLLAVAGIAFSVLFAKGMSGGIGDIFNSLNNDPNAPKISWEASLSDASKKATTSRKLIMIYVYTDSSDECKELDSSTLRSPDVVRASSQFVAVKLNYDTGGVELPQSVHVQAYPTILFTTPDHSEYTRIVGFERGPHVATNLNLIANAYSQSKPGDALPPMSGSDP